MRTPALAGAGSLNCGDSSGLPAGPGTIGFISGSARPSIRSLCWPKTPPSPPSTAAGARIDPNGRRLPASSLCTRQPVCSPSLIQVRLFDPVAYRLRCRLELSAQFLRRPPGPDQFHHPCPILRRIRVLILSHCGLLSPKFSGVHQIGATPTFGAHPNQLGVMMAMGKTEMDRQVDYSIDVFNPKQLPVLFSLKIAVGMSICALKTFQLVFPERFTLTGVLHQGTVVARLPVSPQLMTLPGLPGDCLSSRHV